MFKNGSVVISFLVSSSRKEYTLLILNARGAEAITLNTGKMDYERGFPPRTAHILKICRSLQVYAMLS
jgi:hypothetical protein